MPKKYKGLSSIYYIRLAFFIIAPIVLLLFQSFQTIDGSRGFENYKSYFANKNYMTMTVNSFITAFFITAFTLLIAYPFAYCLTKTKHKDLRMLLIILPTRINLILKIYAFVGILNRNGLVAKIFGKGSEGLLFTNLAFFIVAVYIELPSMVLPIFRSIESIPQQYIIASEDLGASKRQTFTKIILPLSKDGIMAGSQIVFIPCLSLFLVTKIIGGNKIVTLGTAVEEHYLVTQNRGMGATIGLVLIALMLLVMLFLDGGDEKKERKAK